MSFRSAVLLSIVVAAGMPAPTAGQTSPDVTPAAAVQLPPELDRVLRDYERAWRAGDIAALTALFTPDGFVPRPGGWVRGPEGLRAAYSGMAGNDLRLRAYAYGMDGSVGWIVGGYRFGTEEEAGDTGKYVLALRRAADGKWLIAADIDQQNRQPQPTR